MERKRPSPIRRFVLGAAALGLLSANAIASGCSVGFAPISLVDGLRVLAVEADKPYAQPGDTVTFEMTYHDGFVDPEDPDKVRPVNIVWLAGCFNPPGDVYYGCYDTLGKQLGSLFSSSFNPETDIPKLLATGLVGIGSKFQLTLPKDLISGRPKATNGLSHYGLAYVFFLACAGDIGPVDDQGDGLAGSFPIGCFDHVTKQRLGADSFVPGYTQVYAFADGRTNENPVVTGVTLDGEPVAEGDTVEVERCSLSAEERLGPYGCGRPDPLKVCTTYEIDVTLPDDASQVSELDPDGKQADGTQLREVVWVDYFTERGTFDTPVRLVADAADGILSSRSSQWTPPPEPGLARIWAVVHDARGGQSVVIRDVVVK